MKLYSKSVFVGIAGLIGMCLGSQTHKTSNTKPHAAIKNMMNHAPAWSPSENLLLFDSDRDGDTELYTIDPDRGTLRKLTDNQATDGPARWTRNGKFIVFKSDRDGRVKFFQMRPDGSEQKALDNYDETIESVSPDGRTTLTVSTNNGHAVIVAVAQDGTKQQLTRNSIASQPVFSPDGQRIVYEDRIGNDILKSRIVVMNRDGSNAKELAVGTDPSWSPDGSLILFKTPTSHSGGFGLEVSTIRPDGSSFTRLAPGVHPSWSNDGQRIAFMGETSRERTDIWVMNRDGSNKKCLTCAH